MKRLKNITILLCFLSLLAFISCSAEDKTGSGGTRTFSYYAGNWFCISEERGEVNFFTINADGSLIIKHLDGGSDRSVPSTSITKNSDTSYTHHNAEINSSVHFNFTSDTEGTISFEDVASGDRSDTPVTKK